MGKRERGIVIRLVLSIGLMMLLLSRVDVEHLIEDFRSVDPVLYAAGLALFSVYILLWAYRWFLFLHAADKNIPFTSAVSTLLIGFFLSLFLPTIVGTDVGRMYELSRSSDNKVGVVSTVLLDRLVGLISMVVTGAVALVIGGYQYVDNAAIPLLIFGSFIALALGWLLFFNRRFMHLFDAVFKLPVISRFQGTIRHLYRTLYDLQQQPRLLAATLGLSFVMVGLEIASVIVAAWAIGLDTNPVYFFIFMPIIWVLVTIPISISGLGVREGAFVFFLAQVDIGSSHAILISLLYYSYAIVIGVLGGFVTLYNNVQALNAPAQDKTA